MSAPGSGDGGDGGGDRDDDDPIGARHGDGGSIGEGEPRDIDRWMYEFAARLAHDMRTPLGAILMWAHVLRAGREEDRAAAIDAIEASARAQSKMIAELVEISRAVMGRLPIERAEVDVGTLVRSAVQSLAPAAGERDVRIDVGGLAARDAGAAERPVIGDDARLGQAVANLVLRAIKVTPAGRRVEVAVVAAADDVDIVVRDQGPRFDAAERAEMFTPYRATVDPDGAPPLDGAMAAPGAAGGMGLGLGLGLAFARCLVELHGGTIRADDRGAEPGTTVTVRLPLGSARGPDEGPVV